MGRGGVALLDNGRLLQEMRDKKLGAGQIAQVHWGPPLQVLGVSVSVTLYLLLTSLQPLRAHAHAHGEVVFRQPPSRGYAKIPGRVWTWAELISWVGRTSGQEAMRAMVGHTEAALATVALVADLLLPPKLQSLRKPSRRFRCEGCYQLLSVELVYNTTFHPAVISINGQPDLSLHDQSFPAHAHGGRGGGRGQVAKDMLTLLTSEKEVSAEVYEALTEAADNLGVVSVDCLISHELCLTPHDLTYLIDTRREAETENRPIIENAEAPAAEFRDNFRKTYEASDDDILSLVDGSDNMSDTLQREKIDFYSSGVEEKEDMERFRVKMGDSKKNRQGGFTMIYPSPNGKLYDQVINDLYHAVASNTSAAFSPASYLLTESWRHVTRDLHGLLTSLESFYRPLPSGFPPMLASLDLRQDEDIHEKWLRHQEAQKNPCMEDPATAPYLQRIVLLPEVDLKPAFTPLVTSYWAEVEYELITVQVTGVALHCQAEARLEDKFGPSTLVNYTLGLGDNHLTLAVVDIAHSEPWTLNTYTLHLTRRSPPRPRPDVVSRPHHQVCALIQECELRMSPSEPCGLRVESSFTSWAAFLAHAQALKPCSQGDAHGRWVVPCGWCLERATCDWTKAVWQPYVCSHRPLSRPGLQKCLRGKTLVFLGDSTNRGMLYALVEKVNGSLTSWDKTHDLKVIRKVSSGHTNFAFAYYPKFWLPSNQRPVFDKTLYQLLLRAGPLQNNSNTVIVVGGVHWLAVQHLHILTSVLHREGLEGAQVVLKTLGAGFHSAAPGVHTVTARDHSRLLEHSRSLSSYARHRGYHVVDTFNMTSARYRHFLQGKCACHFHQVSSERKPEGEVLYHVEGEINEVYTGILANTICQHPLLPAR
ncbi:cadherin-like and PC-esterase domain-containing protein 1 [Penaeus vannamei]|uniref:cadherin-like and PC-esterase domain-containing protein 1 n=1 Tax=Penaeus vannamei TaxID=6689 RepID=UPI00387F7D30